MKIYKTQEEVEADIVGGVLKINDNVRFECDISIAADINARNINARNINACNIIARDIIAGDINAYNIDAGNINARNIDACNIVYYAICSAYCGIKCKSIRGHRKNSKHLCLDGKIISKL